MGGKVSTSSGGGDAAGRFASAIWQQSNPARKAMFRQLASALSTGGRGMKMPFVQRAVESVTSAGTQALRGADAALSRSLPANIRGRVLNRIARTTESTAKGIGPTVAAGMIKQAPSIVTGAVPSAAGLYSTGISGQQAATEATVARARAFSKAMSSIAQGFGMSQGTTDWLSASPGAGGQGTRPAAGTAPADMPNVPGRDAWVQDPRTGTWTNTGANPSYGGEFDVRGTPAPAARGNWQSWLSRFSA